MRREIDGLSVKLQGDAPQLAQMIKALGATVR
jgi:erythronate-4-phosphate dehydrogenase